MPMRDNASYCRPRLYDHDDPEARDDVALIIESLDTMIDMAMATGDRETIEHATDLKSRMISSAGDHYRDEFGEGDADAEDDE